LSWPASEPAIHTSIAQDFEMDGRLKGGHDMGVYSSFKVFAAVVKAV